ATTAGRGMLWDDSDVQRPRPLGAVSDTPIVFSPNGRLLAGTSGVWDVADPVRPRLLLRFTGSQTNGLVAFSPHSDVLAVAGSGPEGSSVVLWNLRDPARPRIAGSLPVPASQLAFLPHSPILATITFSGSVRLWNVADPATPRAIAGLTGMQVTDQQLLVSPDGTTLAIAGTDSTTQLWNIADPTSPTLRAVLTDATPEAFDPTGQTLAVLATDGSVRLRDVAEKPVIAQICQSTPVIDPATWQRYAANVRYRPICPPRSG
ncbi:MAG TPA: hypothetical protein VFW65_05485, partial [Pseudonocardiaceae bacterium]|nr:hypothetical protein [Pseudonocardiaceae bacterium]